MTLCKMQIELSTVVDAQQIIVTCELVQGHPGAHFGTIRWPPPVLYSGTAFNRGLG